ncbi:hypothetical protein BV25DRAFT_1819617 [Artomyces pyxidatus]|uniref:Uncharacterized protein n=1 Tax=Artomyces pyxidatus TaxID=48021 RepID=A0ACB8TFW2_9AGAM|nr:hypothetical protein BV25DRAFT_1819617 [Artomyces pyxidatus]
MASPYRQAPQANDHVSGEQYRYALTNFAIAHQKVEEQRAQLEQQEKQIALLRERIATLEGSAPSQAKPGQRQGVNTVDDFSIRNTASVLERAIHRWATEIVREPPASLEDLQSAVLADINGSDDREQDEARPMVVQSLLRHAMAEAISEGIVNCLIVTSSSEANVQLTRIHEHIFARDPTVAAVWRRQTFSAAVDAVSSEMSRAILDEHMPALTGLLSPPGASPSANFAAAAAVLDSAYEFSRMLHGSPSTAGGTLDAFYRSFVPEVGSTLYPHQIELVKRCTRSERHETDRVGATIFPGLVKVSRAAPGGQPGVTQAVVRRAQVICECALHAGSGRTPTGTTPAP